MMIFNREFTPIQLAKIAGASVLILGLGTSLFKNSTSIKEKMKLVESFKLELAEQKSVHDAKVAEMSAKISTMEQSHKEKEFQLSKKLEMVSQENNSLKQSSKKSTYKLIKPDGTIIEKNTQESNSENVSSISKQIKEEYAEKLKQTEDKWKTIHEERVAKLKTEHAEELKKIRSENKTVDKTVETHTVVNEKKLRPELGVSSTTSFDLEAYIHTSYKINGPFFIGGGVSGTQKKPGQLRIGVGMEF